MGVATFIVYTVECALLFVTWMTLPLRVTAARRFPSGDHATSHTCDAPMSKHRKEKRAHTTSSHCTVYTFACVAILVMQSDLSVLPVANKLPSGEIAHVFT